MTDYQIWGVAVSVATREYQGLPDTVRDRLEPLLVHVMQCKVRLTEIFEGLAGSEICRLCKGECCRAGRYHFTAVDLLSYLATGRELFSPRFDSGSCPYLGDDGCMMAAVYRPFNCVTFVCDRIDGRMGSLQQSSYEAGCVELREHYMAIEKVFGNRLMNGLLINGERYQEGRSAGIMWGGNGDNK